MRALTINQPSAWAVITGLKNIENRSWPTDFRGRFVVHAAKRFCEEIAEEIEYIFDAVVPSDLPLGACLGTVELYDCQPRRRVRREPWASLNLGGYPGGYCFLLRDPQPFPQPIFMPGQQGWWTPTIYDEEVA